jgi:hypothetical protein
MRGRNSIADFEAGFSEADHLIGFRWAQRILAQTR